tara:strand:+ start:835 stop:1167 length:333 start_codon:yes stop_codon:yes gene_type:complete
MIPRNRDALDEHLEKWEEAIDNWSAAQTIYAEMESMFKAWEAASKTALMQTKMSAAMADSQVKAHPDWGNRYLSVQKGSIAAETKKRILRLAEARWESERSRQVTMRQLK